VKRVLLIVVAAACSKHGSSHDVVGGCAYEHQDGQCTLAGDDTAQANSDDVNVIAVRGRYTWQGAIKPKPVADNYPTPELTLEWTVPKTEADAMRAALKAKPTVACRLEILTTGSCPPWPHIVQLDAPIPNGQQLKDR
jgi:hypothetical protein